MVPDSGFVDVGDVRLSYDVRGSPDALPLVLLHGLTSDRSSWDDVAPALARRWRVYTPDFRGHGRSDWPGRYSFELLRDDLRAFLTGLGISPAILVGHSMGGVAAYLVAQNHPECVEALVLEEVPPPLPQRRPRPERPAGALSYDWAARLALLAQVNEPDPSWWDRIPEIAVPTLVVVGGPESPFPQQELATMAARLPHGRIITIPAGHGVHRVKPAEFAAEVTSFLVRSLSIGPPSPPA